MRYIFATLLSATAMLAAAQSPQFADHSVLSTGKWVKVKVTEEGIHQITAEQLAEWGFADASAVSVWGCGGADFLDNDITAPVMDDLTQTMTTVTADGRLLFYAVADIKLRTGVNASEIYPAPTTDRKINHYAQYGTYFVTDRPAAAIEALAYTASDEPALTAHLAEHFVEHELKPANPQGGSRMVGEPLYNGVAMCQAFDVINHANAEIPYSANGKMAYSAIRYNFIANSDKYTRISATVPSTAATKRSVCSQAAGISRSDIQYSLGNGTIVFIGASGKAIPNGKFEITMTPSSSGEYENGNIDYIYMAYPRTNTLLGLNSAIMSIPYATETTNIRVASANENTQVWNVTTPWDVRPYELHLEHGVATFTAGAEYSADAPARLIAFDASATYPEPEFYCEVSNQNLHGMEAPDMLIITNAELQPFAEELAEAHRRYQGITVAVVPQQQIFNEFSSGTPAAMGYRRFIRMLYDRDPQFKSVLLYGAGPFDNRGIVFHNATGDDYLLTYTCEENEQMRSINTVYSHDGYFGMISDDYTERRIPFATQQVAVGRIPFVDAAGCSDANVKIIDYLSQPRSARPYSSALIVSDHGDTNEHYLQSQQAIKIFNENAPSVKLTAVPALLFPVDEAWEGQRAMIGEALHRGVGYFLYCGHGRESGIQSWEYPDVANNDYAVQPLWITATCHTYVYHMLDKCIAFEAIRRRGGGALAVIGSMTSVYLSYNQSYNLALAKAYSKATEGATIGDIILAGRAELLDSQITEGIGVNSLCFNLCGDPMLPLPVYTNSIVVESINGEAPGETITVASHEPITVTGYIVDANSTAITDFNGKVYVDLFDAPIERESYPKKTNGVLDSQLTLTVNQQLLTQNVATVTDGRFTITLIPPTAGTFDVSNTLALFAETDDLAKAAGCKFEGLVLTENTADTGNFDAPEITEMYINTPDFNQGDLVPSQFTLHARIEAEAGVASASNNIGTQVALHLDGSRSCDYAHTYIVINPDGSATLDMPVMVSSNGQHTLTLSVPDNVGQLSRRTITFYTGAAYRTAEISVDNTNVRDTATFTVADDITNGCLHIEDHAGTTIATADFAGSTCTLDTASIPEGFYRARALFDGGHTEAIDIVVIK